MTKINRRNLLTDKDDAQHRDAAQCPCCSHERTFRDGKPLPCPVCGYPDNTAAFVDYDGCC